MRLISPYGGKLVNLLVAPEERSALAAYAEHLPAIVISDRVACDLELLAVGGFSPLDRFMGQADYQSVLDTMRLADGTIFPMPVTLPVDESSNLRLGQEVALRDGRGRALAILTIEEIYPWNREEFAVKVFSKYDLRHPTVLESQQWGGLNVSGPLRVLRLPARYDFRDLRLTPAETRARLETYGHENVVAFQTRNPMHRVHEELTRRATAEVDGVLLLHPSVGMTKPGDVDHYTRVRTYRALAENHYPPDRILLALLPLAMRMGGPREALWHAIIRRNYGANHFIVGRDHAGPGNDSTGKPFYGPYDAQQLVAQYQHEIGVTMIPFQMFVYLPDEDRYEDIRNVRPGQRTATISGTQVREDYLNRGRLLPAWFTRPEVAEILAEAYPPRHRQGICIWLTDGNAARPDDVARVLAELLLEHGRHATILYGTADDGAASSQTAFLAGEIVNHGGLVVWLGDENAGLRGAIYDAVGADRFVLVRFGAAANGAQPADTMPTLTLDDDGGLDAPERAARAIVQYLRDAGLVRAAERNAERVPAL